MSASFSIAECQKSKTQRNTILDTTKHTATLLYWVHREFCLLPEYRSCRLKVPQKKKKYFFVFLNSALWQQRGFQEAWKKQDFKKNIKSRILHVMPSNFCLLEIHYLQIIYCFLLILLFFPTTWHYRINLSQRKTNHDPQHPQNPQIHKKVLKSFVPSTTQITNGHGNKEKERIWQSS